MSVTATPRPTGHAGYSQTMRRVPESAEAARKLVRAALAAWGQEGLIEDAALVITELVSNAVDHARLESIRVVVTRPSGTLVRFGVVDRSRNVPYLRTDSNGDNTRGRGLLLVDALTDRWGTDRYRWGKQVWGEMKCG
ncbi:ATP-binding protein [Streptomyces malaysiensis subsp. malaysiensis]|uniref:ATP-binding protein n=1 Tax=Streptomyces malaysiensis TaxID=92644 RepID=A0ABX6W332_STRMQ|nr:MULTISPECIES: ATP-binding protein [Streptomyces]QPI55907.1 ATP-binding protein [Streptomyces solisilvae]UHH17378.1 ATP-binding protein [Streptomyces sp. HNM0561]